METNEFKKVRIKNCTCYYLRIRFNKTDELIRIYDGTRYLTLCGSEKYDVIYNKIRYLTSLKAVPHILFLTILRKSNLILMILYLQKKCYVIILVKSILNRDKNHSYYKIFLNAGIK